MGNSLINKINDLANLINTIMRYSEIFETPLGDYQTINTRNYVTKDLKPQMKTLTRVFDRVDFKVNIYFGSNISLPDDPTYANVSHNEDYYLRITPEEFKELNLSIPTPAADDMTIIFWNGNSFELTAWGIVHDIIHALTAEKIPNDLIDGVEADIDNFIRSITKARFGRYGAAARTKKKKYYDQLFTFKSARDGTLRPEEASTELMTQYLITGDIKFNVDNIPEKFRPTLDKLAIKFKNNFQQIIDQGRGKIYLTSA